eukprot:CAMPEP_0115856602 /NCGR_PEP_ID=MMETSP0287-20121206/15140_1 /TAXON_ID=412157 /ORGANISM="Chrysochromulina rotalis, Strain UIO044" /LENGTH=256 /DNA_ID=CAMNT_0003310787 /DNA_START=8 /DNA_END=778 /DNA_ORIENTATION=+
MSDEQSGLDQLKALLASGRPAGFDQLVHAFGSEERCCRCFLRAASSVATAAVANIESTLTFRKDHGLDQIADSTAAATTFDAHPLRPRLPLSFAGLAPDGSVIQYARLASINVRELVGAAKDDFDLRTLVALWLEQALRLQGDSTRSRGAPCPGTYDVYDLKGTNAWSLLWDVKETRGVLGPVLSMGEAHFPDNLHRCFVINASNMFAGIWRICTPFLSERTQRKVSISTTVPKELVEALGGEAEVGKMMASVPEN